MNLLGTILVYTGFLLFFPGLISVVWPLKFLWIATRARGWIVLAGGIALFLLGENLPAPETNVASPSTKLDEFVPTFEFSEFHSIRIRAPQSRVAEAIRQVTPREIALFRLLTWIRRGGRVSEESILNAPPGEPILSVAQRTEFLKLAEDGNQEVVLGTWVARPRGWRPKKNFASNDFKELTAPGFVPAAINFRATDLGNGETLLTTETRVHGTDAASRKRFAAYWRAIYPGSALIRLMWLRAIKRRAETLSGH